MPVTRERRCIVSREVLPDARLVRFVLSPTGEVAPDLAAKLPGRGAWVEARREAVEKAVAKNAFARAFEAQARAPKDLADWVERLLAERCLSQIGLARRAGAVAVGFEKARAALKGGEAALVIEAADGAEDGRSKLLAVWRAMESEAPVLGCFTADEIGAALGRPALTHVVLTSGPHADGLLKEAARLEGFRALAPAAWRVRGD